MRNLLLLLILVYVLSPPITSAIAQTTCPVIVQTALETVADSCVSLERNQICYGHSELSAQGRIPDFTFEQAGDIVDVNLIESVTLSELNEGSGTWGVAMMKLQASIPGTLPGQAVTVLAFGDVAMKNNVPNPIIGWTTANGRLRSTPDTTSDANVLAAVPSGTQLEFTGRNETADWLLVEYDDLNLQSKFTGWLATVVLSLDGDKMTLPVVDFDAKVFAPFQSFILQTGIGEGNCAETPSDGILVQTPEGVTSVSLTVNGVDVELGSTAYLASVSNILEVYLLEGTGYITSQNTTQIAPAGTLTRIPLDEDGLQPVGPPEAPQPYDINLLEALPVTDAMPVLPENIEIMPPLLEEEIAVAIDAAKGDIEPESGTWHSTVTSVITHEDTLMEQQGISACTMHQNVGSTFLWKFTYNPEKQGIDLSSYNGGGFYSEVSPGTYTFSGENNVDSMIFKSPTSFDRHLLYTLDWTGGDGFSYYARCETWVSAVWSGS